MIDCLIIGDSIGVGISQAAPQCVATVKGGVNSRYFHIVNVTANTTIISLGTNDYRELKTEENLRALRQQIRGDVVWIEPIYNANDPIRIIQIIHRIAAERGDRIVTIANSYDGVHPTSNDYKRIAQEALR